MLHPSISPLAQLAALEVRYDGPIPDSELRALRFGSAIAADIAETRNEIAFFRDLIERTRRAGKAWCLAGNREMADHARINCWAYLMAWRTRRRQLADLLHGLERRTVPGFRRRSPSAGAVAADVVAPLTGSTRRISP